jgi:hypothetical protein
MELSEKSKKAIYSSLASEIARMENEVAIIKSRAVAGREEILASELFCWEIALNDNIEAMKEFEALIFK